MSMCDANQAAQEYEETKRRVIAGTASVQEAQSFIDFIEDAIPGPKAQRQDSLDDQIATLIVIANREGCYDAADWLRGLLVARKRFNGG